MDGVSLLRLLRKNPATRDLPVVVTTALYSSGSKEVRALGALGASEYLAKPFTVRGLRDSVSRAHPDGPVDSRGLLGSVTTSMEVPIVGDQLSGSYQTPEDEPAKEVISDAEATAPTDESIASLTMELAPATWQARLEGEPDSRVDLNRCEGGSLVARSGASRRGARTSSGWRSRSPGAVRPGSCVSTSRRSGPPGGRAGGRSD